MTRCAIRNPSVLFVYKKVMTIGLLYGSSVGKALLHVSATGTPNAKLNSRPVRERAVATKKDLKGKGRAMEDDELDQEEEEDDCNSSEQRQDDAFLWEAESCTTDMVFLLFINQFLSCDIPFVYLSLHLDPKAVDVNVHPTKREVHFFDEEHITQRICDAIQDALVVNSGSRMFQYQTLLTGGVLEDKERSKERKEGPTNENDVAEPSSVQKRIYSYNKVRTSDQDWTIDSMFPATNPAQATISKSGKASKMKDIKESDCILTSVRNLRADVVRGRHEGLTEILEKHVFVGIVDLHKCLSLVQHATKLYLINHGSLAYGINSTCWEQFDKSLSQGRVVLSVGITTIWKLWSFSPRSACTYAYSNFIGGGSRR
ncbi:hypothetical protein BU17DRAFT_66740 [Hysterangium stoloniferum]|nr:hypothetical protein BU17DRAFT_66740 [Hysterangium stoloniferum]